jgi:hypothetical protein
VEYYHLAELEATNKKMMVVVVSMNVVDAIKMAHVHRRIAVWYVNNADNLIDKDVRRPKYFLDSAVAVSLMLKTTMSCPPAHLVFRGDWGWRRDFFEDST